jgi:hypothetical protein
MADQQLPLPSTTPRDDRAERGLVRAIDRAIAVLADAVMYTRCARDYKASASGGRREKLEMAITRMQDAESALAAVRPLVSEADRLR